MEMREKISELQQENTKMKQQEEKDQQLKQFNSRISELTLENETLVDQLHQL